MAGLPAELHAYLAQHKLLVTRRHLTGRMGYTVGQVVGWLRRGHLVEVHRGVYTTPNAPASYEHDVLAAVLRAGPGARAGPRASLRLQRAVGFHEEDEAPIDFVIPRDRRVSGVEFIVLRTDVPRVDCTSISGIPCLTAFRSLVHVAPEEQVATLRVAFDDLRRRRLASLTLASTRLPALRHLPGAPILARLLDCGDLEQESPPTGTPTSLGDSRLAQPAWRSTR